MTGASTTERGTDDEALRSLERACRATPHDALAIRGYAAALGRAGQAGRAALELQRALEATSWDAGVLADLDALTRGGLDPEAPWAGPDGDGRRSLRALSAGPREGKIVSVASIRSVELDRFSSWFRVDAEGRAVLGTAHGRSLVAIDPRGHVSELRALDGVPPPEEAVPREAEALLLPGAVASLETFESERGLSRRLTVPGLAPFDLGRDEWLVGPATLIRARTRGATTTISCAALTTGATRWQAALEGPLLAPLALVAGPRVLALGARTLERFDLASGRSDPIALEELVGELAREPEDEDRPGYRGWLAPVEDRLHVHVDGVLVALGHDGAVAWRRKAGAVMAVAGPAAEGVLLVDDRDRGGCAGLEAASGRERWHWRDPGRVALDADGAVYSTGMDGSFERRNPLTGHRVFRLGKGELMTFAIARGRALAIRMSRGGDPEILVIG